MGYSNKESCCCCDLRTGVWFAVILCFCRGFDIISLIAGIIGFLGLIHSDAGKIKIFWWINIITLVIYAVVIVAAICGVAISTKNYMIMGGLAALLPLLFWFYITSVIYSYYKQLDHEEHEYDCKTPGHN